MNERPVLVIKNPDVPQYSPVRRDKTHRKNNEFSGNRTHLKHLSILRMTVHKMIASVITETCRRISVFFVV
jgi:hypothetical protein